MCVENINTTTPSRNKTLKGYCSIFSLKHTKNNNNFNNDFKYNEKAYLKSQENTMVKAIVPLKLIIVNKNIPEFKQLQVILHELEHIKKEHSEISFSSPHYLQKMEAEAEHGRVKADISWYIEETPKEYWNMFNLIDYFEFNSEFENYIEEEFKKIDKD